MKKVITVSRFSSTMAAMDKRKLIIALRLILGVATVAALIRQFNLGSGGSPANFFSYFTNLTRPSVLLSWYEDHAAPG